MAAPASPDPSTIAGAFQIRNYNLALSHIGVRSDIGDSGQPLSDSREVKQCNLWYDRVLDEVLEHHDWPFARLRTKGIKHEAKPPIRQWAYRYKYPFQVVRVHRIEHSNEEYQPPFEIELVVDGGIPSRSIVTNEPEAVFISTARYSTGNYAEHATSFPAHFGDALAWLLAAKVAFSLTGSRQVEADAYEGYIHSVNRAAGTAEGLDSPQIDAPWIVGR